MQLAISASITTARLESGDRECADAARQNTEHAQVQQAKALSLKEARASTAAMNPTPVLREPPAFAAAIPSAAATVATAAKATNASDATTLSPLFSAVGQRRSMPSMPWAAPPCMGSCGHASCGGGAKAGSEKITVSRADAVAALQRATEQGTLASGGAAQAAGPLS